MNKILFIIPILFLVSSSLVNAGINKLQCLDSSITYDSNICYYKIDSLHVYMRSCSSGYECTLEVESKKSRVYACQSKYKKKEEGSSCLLEEECITNNCKDNKCTAKVIGEVCDNDLDCSKDAYCNNGFCKASAKEGEECDSYKGCLAGYDCGRKEKDATKQTCIAEYSIPNGHYSSDSNLCESGLLDRETYLCYDTESKVSEGASCETDSDCKAIKIIGDTQTEISLSCTVTWEHKKICEFGSTSKRWTTYASYYKTEMQKKKVSYSRANGRFSDFARTNDWNVNYYYFQTIPELYNAPSCILDFLNYSNSQWLKLSFVFLLGLILF